MLNFLIRSFVYILFPIFIFRKSQIMIGDYHKKHTIKFNNNDNSNNIGTTELIDRTLILTSGVNNFFKYHTKLLTLFTITSSLFLDLTIIFIMIDAVNNGQSREISILWSSIILRQLSQLIVQIKPVNSLLWKYPGIPSIFVNYNVTTDFYFSGHTVCAVVGYLFLHRLKYFLIGWLFLIFEISFISITHSHYYPDIFTGITTPLAIAYILGY